MGLQQQKLHPPLVYRHHLNYYRNTSHKPDRTAVATRMHIEERRRAPEELCQGGRAR
jgi:hypothetical protein